MIDPYSPFIDNLKVMEELHRRKNQDYAGDGGTYFNFEYAAEIAKHFDDPVDRVFATMIGIKMARLAVLKKPGKKPNHESVNDTHKDLATYTAIWWTYQCEQEAERVKGRRVRTGLRKRVSKASSSRRSSGKNRTRKAKAPSRAYRKDTHRATFTAREVARRIIRDKRIPLEVSG